VLYHISNFPVPNILCCFYVLFLSKNCTARVINVCWKVTQTFTAFRIDFFFPSLLLVQAAFHFWKRFQLLYHVVYTIHFSFARGSRRRKKVGIRAEVRALGLVFALNGYPRTLLRNYGSCSGLVCVCVVNFYFILASCCSVRGSLVDLVCVALWLRLLTLYIYIV